MLLTKLLGATLSPGGARGSLSVLIFHRVLSAPDPLFPDEPDASRFAEILSWVARAFTVIPLAQGVASLNAGTLPPRALAITFDDGYEDNFTAALPVLQRFGMHATFFVASGFLDGGRMWNDTVIESVRACTASASLLIDRSMCPSFQVCPTTNPKPKARRIMSHVRRLGVLFDSIAFMCGSPVGSGVLACSR